LVIGDARSVIGEAKLSSRVTRHLFRITHQNQVRQEQKIVTGSFFGVRGAASYITGG
jgi:hypothetical protein